MRRPLVWTRASYQQEEGAHGGAGGPEGQSESRGGETRSPETRSHSHGCHEVCRHSGGGHVESGRGGGRTGHSSFNRDRPSPSTLRVDDGDRIPDGMVPGLLSLLSSAYSLRAKLRFQD